MRVMSYNIHRGVGGRDGRYRPQRVIDVIESQNPDIVCLQEVARNSRKYRYDDQPQMIADFLRPECVEFQGNVRLKEGVWGNMLLSRWPIEEIHRISLTWKGKKARGAILAVIATPEGPLQIINWHLGLSERERLWQAKHLMEHHLFRKLAHLPTLLIGDSNDWRNRLWSTTLAAHGFRLITHPGSRFRTFPAMLPMGALDKAYLLGNVQVRSSSVVRTRMAKIASDHLPLIVDLHMVDPNSNGTED